MISIIVARAKNGVIGKDNKLIWHISDDLKYFKKCTTGHPIIMGRKTFESFPNLLPNRTHYVLTRDKNYKAQDEVKVFNDVETLVKSLPEGENFVIGGGHIYKAFLEKADKLYITEIEKEYEGDTYFPDIDMNEWEIEKEIESEDKTVPHKFVVYKRKNI